MRAEKSGCCTYLICCQKAPGENANFLNERNLVHTIWQVRRLNVDDVLEVLSETIVKRVQIDFAMDNTEQAIMLVDCQVVQNGLCLSFGFLLRCCAGQSLCQKEIVNSFQRRMTSTNQVTKVVSRRGFVFNHDQQKLQSQSGG